MKIMELREGQVKIEASPKTIRVVAVVAHCMCDDGKIRKVQLGGQQPKQLHRFLKQVSGGMIKLSAESCLIVAEKKSLVDKLRQTVRKLRAPRPVPQSQVANRNSQMSI